MRLVERFRLFALLLVLLAMVAFCVSQRSVALLLVALPLAILSWYVTEGPRGRALPRWMQNVLLASLLGWAAFAFMTLPDLSDTMGLLGRFVQWLLLVKLYGRKSPRDYAQIIALSGVLVMAGTLQTVEFAFAVIVFLYAALALWTVLLFQLWAARERARDARMRAIMVARNTFGPSSSAALAPPVQPVFGQSVAWQFRAVAIASTLMGLLLSIVIFVIFPRELSDFARREFRFGAPRVGFSEDVQLFTNNRITDSEREVFTVNWSDRRGESMRFSEPLYLRGAVLDRYRPEEGRWIRAPRGEIRAISTYASDGRKDGSHSGEFQSLARFVIDERFQTYVQQVTMSSLASDVLFSAWAPIAVASNEGRNFEFDPSTFLVRESRIGGGGRSRRYSIKVQPFPSEKTLEALMGAFIPEANVNFPVPQIEQFSRELLDQLNPIGVPSAAEIAEKPESRWIRNRGIARAFSEWLQSSRFSYTTDLGGFVRITGEDPIFSFLTRYRFGHCEYFASALVAMCQSVGIESRVVTGYLAIEYDETRELYVVRESNAHAWAEVRVGEFSWLQMDATPSETLALLQERRRSWADNFRWVYDRVEFLWNSRVVTFDSSTQASLAEQMSGAWQRSFRDWLLAAQEQLRRLNQYFVFGSAGTWWLGLVGFAAVLSVLVIARLRRRTQRLRRVVGLERDGVASRGVARRLARHLMQQLGFWLDVLDTLDRHGVGKPAALPPRLHAEVLSQSRPQAGETFADLVDLYYDVRFAGRPLDSSRRQRANELVQRLDRELAAGR